jgi:hypothetical protein
MRQKQFLGVILFVVNTISAIALEEIPIEKAARDTHTFSLYIENDKMPSKPSVPLPFPSPTKNDTR